MGSTGFRTMTAAITAERGAIPPGLVQYRSPQEIAAETLAARQGRVPASDTRTDTSFRGGGAPLDLSFEDITPANEECSDGGDDGHIGFWQGLWHMGKGIVKSSWGALKGMAFDKDGSFSPLRLAATAGLAAGCMLIPGAGVVLGAAGALMGGWQAVKGAVNIANAKTDAEVKAACQDFGAGVFTAGLAALGAKSSYGAMQKAAGTSQLAALKEAAKTGEKMTKMQYASAWVKAFWADTKASAANNYNKFTTEGLGRWIRHPKQTWEAHKAAKAAAAPAEGMPKPDGVFKRIGAKIKRGWEKITGKKEKEAVKSAENAVNAAKENVTKANAAFEAAGTGTPQQSAAAADIAREKSALSIAQSALDTAKEAASLTARAKEIIESIKTIGRAETYAKYGYKTVNQALLAFTGLKLGVDNH